MHTEIRTERLHLRPWRESDAQALYRCARDPAVGPAAGWPVHTSVENSGEIIRQVLMVPETYCICLAGTDRAIGCVGLKLGSDTDLTDRADECELGYWLGREWWGRGFVPEAARALLRHAFMDLGMAAVWCGSYDGNRKSRRVQEKLGFVYHHTTECVEVPLLGEVRRGHVTCLTREVWLARERA